MKFLMFFLTSLIVTCVAFADDPGMPDTVIVDTVYVDLGQPHVDVPIYAVTDEHVAFYNMPITWSSMSEGIVPVDVFYFGIIRAWDETYDSIFVENNFIRMYGWTEHLGAFLNTDSLRLHCWSIQFAVDSSAAPQIVTIDTTFDFPNGSLLFVLEGGIEWIVPTVIPGAIYYGIPAEVTENQQILPSNIALLRNYPNPFNASTNIEFTLPEEAQVELSVYNILGQKVADLFDERKPAGAHSMTWDAGAYPSGVYFARLETEGYSKNIKMVLLR
ncbi:MAG: T9SS type A sorting domain-containing protein [Candidatus Zixiibacteriota bacterium]|nr:MAG: T9SS type A sorting domain-containing protein [candidate division Zixibacteria bacterium]